VEFEASQTSEEELQRQEQFLENATFVCEVQGASGNLQTGSAFY